jgi:hypothetical protein
MKNTDTQNKPSFNRVFAFFVILEIIWNEVKGFSFYHCHWNRGNINVAVNLSKSLAIIKRSYELQYMQSIFCTTKR